MKRCVECTEIIEISLEVLKGVVLWYLGNKEFGCGGGGTHYRRKWSCEEIAEKILLHQFPDTRKALGVMK